MENKISYTAVMSVFDYDTLAFSSSEKEKTKDSDTFILDASQKTHQTSFTGKCGESMSIELGIIFEQNSNGSISIKDFAKLYEANSICSTHLECATSTSRTILKNQTEVVIFRIYTTDENYVDITLTVTNSDLNGFNSVANITMTEMNSLLYENNKTYYMANNTLGKTKISATKRGYNCLIDIDDIYGVYGTRIKPIYGGIWQNWAKAA